MIREEWRFRFRRQLLYPTELRAQPMGGIQRPLRPYFNPKDQFSRGDAEVQRFFRQSPQSRDLRDFADYRR